MMRGLHGSTKTYGHEIGLSCCFRQHKATSHCRFLHGYALRVKLEFTGDLDETNWVVDFGSLKPVKKWLEDTFDHKLLVAADDPHIEELSSLEDFALAQLRVLPAVGCEAFAAHIGEWVAEWVFLEYGERVRLTWVEVAEHGANSAFYIPPYHTSKESK